MAQDADQAEEARPAGRKRRIAGKSAGILCIALLLALAIAWLQRERIVDDVIADELAKRGIEATYTVESIATGRQVLTDIVIGDPALPDLTIERMEVLTNPRFGMPELRELRLTRPRLYGSYRDGQASFGALDPLLFTDGEEPFEIPDLSVVIDDGRALMVTDYGRVGVKLEGAGHLRGGFSGELAAVAPEVDASGCSVREASLYGTVAIDAERPQFAGPLRFARLLCEDGGVEVAGAGVELVLQAERNLGNLSGSYDLAAESVAISEIQAALQGEGRFAWRDDDLTLDYDLVAGDAKTPYADFASLAVEGRVRATGSFAQIEIEGDLAGEDLRMGPQLDGAIASLAEAGQGTLVEPLVNRLGLNLARALRDSRIDGSFNLRLQDGRASLAIPRANLRGQSGGSILSVSRGQATFGDGGLPRFAGNILTGGEGLPFIRGRMEQGASGAVEMRLAMREYSAGASRLTIPDLIVRQTAAGGLTVDGSAIASGPIPGGMVRSLAVPLNGSVAPNGDLAFWRECTQVQFAGLVVANLTLERDAIRLCPEGAQPIFRQTDAGLRFAATTDSLDLAGRLSETPLRIASGPVRLAYPGTATAQNVDAILGGDESEQRFSFAALTMTLDGGDPSGAFTGGDIKLAAVPLDIGDADGGWAFADGVLRIDDAELTVQDREGPDRFEPIIARGASLVLADNVINANALLRNPGTGIPLSRIDIRHDLDTGAGFADLDIDGVTFGEALQPDDLTRLALGVVANVEGTITGNGRINWNEGGVTSTGRFSSESLNLAAAFGPLQGASGTVEFTDLLGLTTAPDQRIRIAAVNPGIEVYEGEVSFQLVEGEVLQLQRASWPFMGGTLTMRPITMRFGEAEERSYVFVIEGLEASRFVERIELGNLAASGIFDGTIPVIFDADGNGRLENGLLMSRPPGGHISYIGELTYEDMSFFANYAFAALRDLRYDRMEVSMNGPLTGELVTQVRFNGIGQGDTAERNIITRAIADLPIDMRINIRAPFHKLITSIRALYDPSAVRDPRSLGLLSDDGVRLREAVDQETVDVMDAAAAAEAERELQQRLDAEPGAEPDIQDDESDDLP
ncbi:intermembrane phospholipid transport protein YdbH family protein [Aurantiacibacter gangjinensis]|uniref:Uncharacterized protein n=1 Tax=Aurantiacibacter gangjinensis TaxID=502682 RepID=A0A0G9MPN9_9SPHN|nr:YdbH domain-containing protein [Aurantiacibacter gangjinensis]APE28454.1 Putative uncharacterized protein ydbH [Aurantiacibacter gangjinensis]KLE32665.1 hypothetical protein AAW01_00995 [Aurantiacibacter gangjinensis]